MGSPPATAVQSPLAGHCLHRGAARWPGVADDGGLVLPLPAQLLARLPSALQVDGRRFDRKHELHLTLLDREQTRQVRAAIGDATLRALFEACRWEVHTDGRLHLVAAEDGEAASIIVGVHAPAAAHLRDRLRTFGLELEPPTPHVTLYTAGKAGGIGLSGPTQWRRRVRAGLQVDAWHEDPAPAHRLPSG